MALRRTITMTNLPNQGVGGLGQDPALNHVAVEASNAT